MIDVVGGIFCVLVGIFCFESRSVNHKVCYFWPGSRLPHLYLCCATVDSCNYQKAEGRKVKDHSMCNRKKNAVGRVYTQSQNNWAVFPYYYPEAGSCKLEREVVIVGDH